MARRSSSSEGIDVVGRFLRSFLADSAVADGEWGESGGGEADAGDNVSCREGAEDALPLDLLLVVVVVWWVRPV